MKDLRRSISARQAQRRGQNFENILHAECYRNGWHVMKIHMGAKHVSATKIIRMTNPFDFIFLKKGRVVFADAKTTKAKSFSFSALTPHQVRDLSECHKNNQTAGYIVHFSEIKQIIFFNGSQLASMHSGGSLKPNDGILIGENNIILLDRIFQDSTSTHDGGMLNK